MKNIYLLLLLIITPCTINANIITGSELLHLGMPGISLPDGPDENDRFGRAVSHGDYNGDGFQDLAISIPGYDRGAGLMNTGVVLILFGSPSGFNTFSERLLVQNNAETNDFFGSSLASGDFNCDGITDLAVGSPLEDFGSPGSSIRENVGMISIFYGSSDRGPAIWQDSTSLFQGNGGAGSSENEEGDRFGWSMAAGDFDGDDCDDLAASAPFEDFPGITDAGQVEVYYGRPQGLSGQPDFRESFNQINDGNTATVAESGDEFGYSLATGNLNATNTSLRRDDLVVGIPGDSVDGIPNAGAIQVFMGHPFGLNEGVGSDIWSQSGDIIGIVEEGDRFGHSVTVGNFNNTSSIFRLDDVAIGATGEDLNGLEINNVGSVNVIYGGNTFLRTDGNQIFHQNINGVAGVAEFDDRFGETLTSGDLNGDGIDDLVIGVPRENNSRGAFHVLHGSSEGITTDDSLFEINIGDGVVNDRMGDAMAIANFGNGPQLAVGIPGDDSSDGDNNAGSVEVFSFRNFDLIFANSFEE